MGGALYQRRSSVKGFLALCLWASNCSVSCARRMDTNTEASPRSAVRCVGLSGLLIFKFMIPGPHCPGRGCVGPIGPQPQEATFIDVATIIHNKRIAVASGEAWQLVAGAEA